eukprot:1538235-Amphidinium_carterae.1
MVTEFKTARVRDRRGLALPVCAQEKGLSGLEWASTFVVARAPLMVKAGPGLPFFPVIEGGKLSDNIWYHCAGSNISDPEACGKGHQGRCCQGCETGRFWFSQLQAD